MRCERTCMPTYQSTKMCLFNTTMIKPLKHLFNFLLSCAFSLSLSPSLTLALIHSHDASILNTLCLVACVPPKLVSLILNHHVNQPH